MEKGAELINLADVDNNGILTCLDDPEYREKLYNSCNPNHTQYYTNRMEIYRDEKIADMKKYGMLCPMNTDVIGYKKCILIRRDKFMQYRAGFGDIYNIRCSMVIVSLSIPKSATHIQPLKLDHPMPSIKCRTNRAKVLSIENTCGDPITIEDDQICISPRAFYGRRFKYKEYKPGHWIFANDLDTNIEEECSTGISFFMLREHARNYEPFM